MEKIIIDTNVLIDGVQDENSYAYKIINLCLEGEIQPVVSSAIRRENELLAERNILDEEYLNILDDYFDTAEFINVKTKKKIIDDDHEDDKFIHAAIDSETKYIVSSDRHLLDLGEYQGIKMLTPGDYLNDYRNRKSEGEEFQEWAKNIGIG